ncbi:MAG: hypothetical protein EOO15_10850 [Chitinophagaceae bacterium]|nr:MAG: hypothetical protein EOO15_10850 [Chitinophagaceae bacterium]
MSQRLFILIATILLSGTGAFTQNALTTAQYREDFDALWTTVQEQYAYWPEKNTDWQCVRVRWQEAIKPLLPACLRKADTAAQLYALQLLAAGNHRDARRLEISDKGIMKEFTPDRFLNIDTLHYDGLLSSAIVEGNIGMITINNSLGDEDLIPAFDSILNSMMNTSGLVLDLRQTQSGGTSTVARAIMGRLLKKEGYYQRHELPADSGRWGVKRSWVEIVAPRGKTYTKPVVVLVGAWTGSMGEGIAVGLHGLRRAQIAGHPMAGLNGAIYSFRLPNSGIGYSVSAERLSHINGTPREHFNNIKAVPESRPGVDGGLQGALQLLRGKRS